MAFLTNGGARAAAVLGALVLVAVTSGTAAQAADSPRLAGRWTVKTTIIQHDQVPRDVGSTSKAPWKFKPGCAAPAGCATVLVRTRLSGHPDTATTTLTPDGLQYTGTTVYKSACFPNNGGVVEKAYSTKETTTINVLKTNADNRVTAFKGQLKLVFSLTAVGKNHGCKNDKIVLKLHST